MSRTHTNGSALRAWLDVATAGLSAELAGRAADDIRLHVYAAQEEGIARGMDPEDAYRRALESLGDAEEVNRMYLDGSLEGQFDQHSESESHPSRIGTGKEEALPVNMPRLVWESADVSSADDGGRKWYEITRPEVLIGRKDDNDVLVLHPSASRHHAKLVAVTDGYDLVDLDSAYGTFVNGTRIQRHRLKTGDRIRIARDEAELSYL